jgi:hypothetical protein
MGYWVTVTPLLPRAPTVSIAKVVETEEQQAAAESAPPEA